MIALISEVAKIAGFSLVGWMVFGGYFVIAEKWSRIPFVVFHYATCILTTLLMAYLYVKFVRSLELSVFQIMITTMISLFTIEIIFFTFVYDKSTWFLNFTDWIVPVFLIASTMYLATEYFIKHSS